jgi:hypothetical protein
MTPAQTPGGRARGGGGGGVEQGGVDTSNNTGDTSEQIHTVLSMQLDFQRTPCIVERLQCSGAGPRLLLAQQRPLRVGVRREQG